MKVMTKEWVKDTEFLDLIVMLEPNTDKKIPFVFMNGGTDCVAKEDLYTVKTNLNVTEKENEINFIMLPDKFDLEIDYLGDGEHINETTCKNDFLIQYLNNLRIISYLPEDILKHVKDKRLLALGYAEKEVKQKILKYIKEKYRKAMDIFDECNDATVNAEKELTIHRQFKEHIFIHSVPHMFDGVKITKAEKNKDNIYLTLDDSINIIFSEAEKIEEEADILNTYVNGVELYKIKDGYEIHFLLSQWDENLINRFYYAVYTFKDLKFGN